MSGLEKNGDAGCLIREDFAQEICDHIDNAAIHQPAPPVPDPSNAAPVADNEADTAIRAGQAGTSSDYARADHNHPIRRQANPGDPTITLTGAGGTLTQAIVLDRWSEEEHYAYRFRCRLDIDAGTGWIYLTVPAIAGFQQPDISGVGSYRFTSNAPQDDDSVNGAAPRGPFMGAEAHHWSSTNRIYHAYFRRDNAYSTFIEFTVNYRRV
jgi:hypothetical protein